MSDTALIEAAFRQAARPLTLEEVLEATQLEDAWKASVLIYYLVNQRRLRKDSPTDDGNPRWRAPGIDKAAEPVSSVKVPAGQAPEVPRIKPTAAGAMNLSREADLPHVRVNFGTRMLVISIGNDAIKIDSLAAAQSLHAQMEQAVVALEALDGR